MRGLVSALGRTNSAPASSTKLTQRTRSWPGPLSEIPYSQCPPKDCNKRIFHRKIRMIQRPVLQNALHFPPKPKHRPPVPPYAIRCKWMLGSPVVLFACRALSPSASGQLWRQSFPSVSD